MNCVRQVLVLGILQWISMFSFERNNKRLKGLVRNSKNPISSLANNLEMDQATRISVYTNTDALLRGSPMCELKSKNRYCPLSDREKMHLAILGVTSFSRVHGFDAALILGVHFRTGGWGRSRCGSVIVTMYGGRSRYCVVQKFLQVQGKVFARVLWLSTPVYPYAPNLLVVKVRELTVAEQQRHRCVISVRKIEPCSVAVMPDEDGVHYYPMRSKGVDRVLI